MNEIGHVLLFNLVAYAKSRVLVAGADGVTAVVAYVECLPRSSYSIRWYLGADRGEEHENWTDTEAEPYVVGDPGLRAYMQREWETHRRSKWILGQE